MTPADPSKRRVRGRWFIREFAVKIGPSVTGGRTCHCKPEVENALPTIVFSGGEVYITGPSEMEKPIPAKIGITLDSCD
jgi:hypothetical protein